MTRILDLVELTICERTGEGTLRVAQVESDLKTAAFDDYEAAKVFGKEVVSRYNGHVDLVRTIAWMLDIHDGVMPAAERAGSIAHARAIVAKESGQAKTIFATFDAALRSDRKRKPERRRYRMLTPDECRTLVGGSRATVVDAQGRIGEVKITSVKTWKKRPDIEVRWQFGLYEHGEETITPNRPNSFFVVEVEDGQ